MDLISDNLTISGEGPNPRVAEAVASLFHDQADGIDLAAGTFSTKWFTAHKGEIRLKVEAGVSGRHVRFEAWQDTGLIFKSPVKTDAARRQERHYEEALQALLAGEFRPIAAKLSIDEKAKTFVVTTSEPAFVALFGPGSESRPMLLSDLSQIDGKTSMTLSKAGKAISLPKLEVQENYGLVVARTAEELARYVKTIRFWPQLDVMLTAHP